MKKLVIIALVAICCTSSKNQNLSRAEHLRNLIEKIGFLNLPYVYSRDAIKSNYSVNRNSMDTLFFTDLNSPIAGVFPDTTSYFAFLFYKVGDDLVPFIISVDKLGNVIDEESISIGNCSGYAIDIESCVNQTRINKDLSIELFYKIVGTAETNDSVPKEIPICNRIVGKGRITKDGKIEINKGELEVCN